MRKRVHVRVSFSEGLVDEHQEGRFFWKFQPRIAIVPWKLNSEDVRQISEETKQFIQKKYKGKKLTLKVK